MGYVLIALAPFVIFAIALILAFTLPDIREIG